MLDRWITEVKQKEWEILVQKRMHSNRMRTVRSLTVSRSIW